MMPSELLISYLSTRFSNFQSTLSYLPSKMSTAEKRSAEEVPEAVKKAKTAEDEEENIEEEEDDLDEEGEEGEEGEDEEDGEDEGVGFDQFFCLKHTCLNELLSGRRRRRRG